MPRLILFRVFLPRVRSAFRGGLLSVLPSLGPKSALIATIFELRFALALCRDGAVCPDGLSYPFLRQLNPTAMGFLLSFFNWIYSSELFPDL